MARAGTEHPKREFVSSALTGTILAFASFVWTSYWTFEIWADGSIRMPEPGIVIVPMALSGLAVVTGNRPSAPTVRFLTASILLFWAVLLFAWMFMLSGGLMAAAAGLSAAREADAKVPPGDHP